MVAAGRNVRDMEAQSTLRVSLKTNPAIAEAIQKSAIGDKFDIEAKCTISDIKPDEVVLNIEALVPEGYEVADDGDEKTDAPIPPAVGIMSDNSIPTALASIIKKKA